ncbi:MAG: FAD-binding oxidoreductase [Geminicoccaceae bacterium]
MDNLPITTHVERAIERLRPLFGDRLSTAPALLDQHGRGEAYHESRPPDAVVFVRTTNEVSRVVSICNGEKVPVIAFGAGTSLEGHVAAVKGGISVDLTGMNAVLEVNSSDLDVRVEAGVTRKQLNSELRDTGLFFPIDPGADATLGGMAATRASGTNAVRYGTMRDVVLGLTAVLADGTVIETGGRARKSSTGYDLTRLLVGSEGTLGIITRLRLRLFGVPEAISAAVCSFETVEGAVATVIETIQCGVPVARIELLDELQMSACIAFSKLKELEPKPTLFLEFHGSEAGVREQSELVQALAESQGGSAFRWTVHAEERNRLWQARHDVYYAALALRPGAKSWATDVCVPISVLADHIDAARRDIEASGLIAPIVGHVGDGNFHVQFLLDPDAPGEWQTAATINDAMVDRALAAGGTASGEHGIGLGKIEKAAKEQGQAISVMAQIKRALDPNGILNPSKMFLP